MDPSNQVPLAQIGRAITEACRSRNLRGRTADLYLGWARRFVIFHNGTHPGRMGVVHVRTFLTHHCHLSTSSLRQALLALRFLYQHVLHQPLPDSACTGMRARRPSQQIGSTTPTRSEIEATIARLRGTPRLVALLQYGSGLRLREIIALRLADLDLDQGCMRISDREAKLSAAIIPGLQAHATMRRLDGAGAADPLFTSRHGQQPLSEQSIQRAYRTTGAGLTPRALRVGFAMHLIEQGVNLRQLQVLMGLRDIRTTERYLGLTARGPGGITSPLDSALGDFVPLAP